MTIQQIKHNLYSKFARKQFRLIASLFCLMGDLAICRFIYLKMTSEEMFLMVMQRVQESLSQAGVNELQARPDVFHAQIYELMIRSLTLTFIAVIAIHLITYAFFIIRNSKAAIVYIRCMAWVGAPGFFVLGLTSLGLIPLGPYLIFQSILYLFVGLGISYFIEQERKAQ